MSKTDRRPKPSLILLWLTCALIATGCAGNSRAVKPEICPVLPPPPANVMREPSAEKKLRELLFVSPETATTSSEPAKR